VAGKEYERPVRPQCCVAEALQRRVELRLAEIVALSDLEARAPQRRRNSYRIAHRVGQRCGLLIGRVADDERDAAPGHGCAGKENAKRQRQNGTGHGDHWRLRR
jgi:hypothetical protein